MTASIVPDFGMVIVALPVLPPPITIGAHLADKMLYVIDKWHPHP
jgi:hypothetical protein